MNIRQSVNKKDSRTMNIRRSVIYLAVLLMIPMGALNAYALGTLANTMIANTATAKYTVGTQNLTASSTPTTLVVDRKVIFTVSEVGGTYGTSTAGMTNSALTFTVKNDSNATLDFPLNFSHRTGGTDPPPLGGTDTFDATNIKFFRDSNGNGVFDPLVDTTQVTFLDGIAPDTIVTVFVVGDIPSNRVDGDISSGTLRATAAEGGAAGTQGATLSATIGGNTNSMDTVFADLAGADPADTARDGEHSALDGYKVVMPTVAVMKTFSVIDDPVNGTSTPLAIPGATVEYCIEVRNNGSTSATNIVVEDIIQTGTTFKRGSIVTGATATNGVCTGGTAQADTGLISGSTVTITIPSLGAVASTAFRFRVTINAQ